jgi:hypothetical protein
VEVLDSAQSYKESFARLKKLMLDFGLEWQ